MLQCIVQDTSKFLKAIKVIAKNKGIAVAGLGTCKAHRSEGEGVRNLKKRGGRRIKGDNSFNKWMRNDLKSEMSSYIPLSISMHQ